jgi:hypothetical protein
MIKHILIAVTTALLVLPNLSSTILAEPPEVPDDAGTHRPRFSAGHFAAFTDARIAALKSGGIVRVGAFQSGAQQLGQYYHIGCYWGHLEKYSLEAGRSAIEVAAGPV